MNYECGKYNDGFIIWILIMYDFGKIVKIFWFFVGDGRCLECIVCICKNSM